MAAPTQTDVTPLSAPAGGSLTIEAIEVTPIVVPLDQEYRGSYYRMTNRSTVLTRVITREGIVGEAYAGDEDATLGEIVAVIKDELTPRLIGQDGFAIERCWELGFPVTYDLLRDRRIGLVALASIDLALWDAIGKALNRPLFQLWGGYRDSLGVNIIGGYYGPDLAGIREEVTEWRELGFRGCKFKVGAQAPAEDASASKPPAKPAATTSCSRSTPTRATRAPRRSSSAGVSATSTSAGSRSRASGATTHATCATYARPAESPSARDRVSIRRRAAAT